MEQNWLYLSSHHGAYYVCCCLSVVYLKDHFTKGTVTQYVTSSR